MASPGPLLTPVIYSGLSALQAQHASPCLLAFADAVPSVWGSLLLSFPGKGFLQAPDWKSLPKAFRWY